MEEDRLANLWISVIQDLRATKNNRTRIFLQWIYSNQSLMFKTRLDAYPSWDKVLLNNQCKHKLFYGGHSSVLPLFQLQSSAIITTSNSKVWCPNMRITYQQFYKEFIILNFYFSLASFFFEPKSWHGDSQSHFFFPL